MSEILTIQKCIYLTSPKVLDDINWKQIETSLVIIFKDNTGDLHIEVRKNLNFNVGSNKTHIDVTSGKDVVQGLSPVSDFFIVNDKKVKVPVFVHEQNIFDISELSGENLSWIKDTVTVNTLKPRNKSQNPSIQLLEKNDIEKIRIKQSIGDCLIFLKHLNGEIFVLGVKSTNELYKIMRGKTKRMFRFLEASRRPVITSSNEFFQDDLFNINKNNKKIPIRINDPKLNSAIEIYGVEICRKYCHAKGYKTIDVSKPDLAEKVGLPKYPGYDELAIKNKKKLKLEIKSTLTAGNQVNISSNELLSALIENDWRLVVVSNIKKIDNLNNLKDGNINIYKIKNTRNLRLHLEKISELINLAEMDGLKIVPSYNINVPNFFELSTI